MSELVQTFRIAWRGLARRPGFALVAVLALALGIGANTAIYSVVDAALLRPLPYPDAGQIVRVFAYEEGGQVSPGLSGAGFLDLTQARSLSAVAAARDTAFNISDGRGEGAERVGGTVATPSLFSVLGARPLLGRFFTEGAAREGGHEVVIAEELWRSRYDAARDIVGRELVLNGETYTVVGVIPDALRWPLATKLFVPPRGRIPEHPLRPTMDQTQVRDSRYLEGIARLAPGVSLAQAQTELDVIRAGLVKALGTTNNVDGGRLVPLRDDLVGNTRPQLLVLFGAVGLILLIACTNVAHLLLARALARRHEVAVRLALGATRARLALLFFAESSTLALLGAGAGVLLALWGVPPLVALGPPELRALPAAVNGRVLFFTALVALATALVFSLVPALTIGRGSSAALGDDGRAATAGGRRAFLRSTLVSLEVALSLVLLVGAGLLVRSFANLARVSPGFAAEGALTADVWLPQQTYATPDRRARFYHEVLEEVATAPGVVAAGAVNRLPLSSGNSSRSMSFPGREDSVDADYRAATPGYLEAMGIPLRRGRGFAESDRADGQRVALCNEAFARQAWPGQDPLGKTILPTLDMKPAEIVGVIGNVRHTGLDGAERPEVYVPANVDPWPFMSFVVRGHVPPDRLTGVLRQAVAGRDATLGLARIMPLERRVDLSLSGRRFNMLVLGALAGLALLLALVGIYGVCAYTVGQRTRELGIRLALGARPSGLFRLVVGQSMRPVLVGLAAGLVIAAGATRLMGSLLFGVSAGDPLTYVAVAGALGLTAALASFAAARRAATVEPIVALRSE